MGADGTRGRTVVSAGVDGAWDILVTRAADAYGVGGVLLFLPV